MTVEFWTFSKRKNSTARPSGNPAYTFNCTLKDASGILRPVLEIYQSAAFNPSALNYARIAAYGRYYYAADWEWIVGRWEVTLQVDAMASYKTQIGSAEKYVLRSAHARNLNIVDTLYPSETWAVSETVTGTFNWTRSITAGNFVLGIVNRSQHLGMPVTYYRVTTSTIRKMMRLMLPQPVDDWASALSYTSQSLVRAIYDPMQFVVSCRWFPCPVAVDDLELLGFGNYDGNFVDAEDPNPMEANPVSNPVNWSGYQQILSLPSGWLSRPARERSNPYCRIYVKCNPWGVVELDPMDLTTSDAIVLRAFPDYISGDGRLEILERTGSVLRLIYQSNAKISVDIQLSNTSQNVGAFLSALAGVATAAGSGAGVLLSTLSAAGSALDAAAQFQPTLSRSGGVLSGMVNLDGEGEMRIRTNYFPPEDVAELGRPLYDVRVLNMLPGYIKCADGDISLAAFPEEVDDVSNYLTGGFYYE